MSVRSAQRIDRGELQSQGQQHQSRRQWRTRADPLANLHLERNFPGQEWYRRKRTLQRRVEQWKAWHGPSREVILLQEHGPGVLGISDFTLLKGEPITISGEVLEHRLFHVRLPYSGWCHVEVIYGGESFVALAGHVAGVVRLGCEPGERKPWADGAYLPATAATQQGLVDVPGHPRCRAHQQRSRACSAAIPDSAQDQSWRPSSQGAICRSRLLTVTTSLRQQGRDVWQFQEQACIAHRRGGVMPSLLPAL